MPVADDIRADHLRSRDFLGAFAVIERAGRMLMVQNARHIGGALVTTWDLPGGQVENGELLHEALRRELREETGLAVAGTPRLLFVQEGQREQAGCRQYAWRSFFFACAVQGEPRAGGEVLAVRWCARDELAAVLTAPYHDSFASWLRREGRDVQADAGCGWHESIWRD